MKAGIYRTVYGNAALVGGQRAKSAFDLDMGERIPISQVSGEYIRKIEPDDRLQVYNTEKRL